MDKEANNKQETVEPEPTVDGHVGESMLIKPQTNGSKGKEIEGHAFMVLVDTMLRFLDIPTVAQEFTAILQFNMSYELMEWLGRQMTFATSRPKKEHEEREMINKVLEELRYAQEALE